jgi:hypothetical protein
LIKILCDALVKIITITLVLQYLIDIVNIEKDLSSLQKCQQDKLLIRKMILVDYKNSESKQFVAVKPGFSIDVKLGEYIYKTEYICRKNDNGVVELYKQAADNPRAKRAEAISREVKGFTFLSDSIQINFKNPKCNPLVIKNAFKNRRQ